MVLEATSWRIQKQKICRDLEKGWKTITNQIGEVSVSIGNSTDGKKTHELTPLAWSS